MEASSSEPSLPEALAVKVHQFSLGRRKLSRQKSGSSDHPEGIVSLKLSEDGHLIQEGTDIEIEVPSLRHVLLFGFLVFRASSGHGDYDWSDSV